MSEVWFAVGEADADRQERLDKEISEFNAAVTGHDDGRMLSVAVRGDDGDLRAGLYGWTWGRCGYIEPLWYGTTSVVMAWEPGCWPPHRHRPVMGMLAWNAAARSPSAVADIRTLPLVGDSVDDIVAASCSTTSPTRLAGRTISNGVSGSGHRRCLHAGH